MCPANRVVWKYAIFGAAVGVVLTLITIGMYRLSEPEGSLVSYFSFYDLEERFGFTYQLPWFESQRKQVSILSTVFVSNALFSGFVGAIFGCALRLYRR